MPPAAIHTFLACLLSTSYVAGMKPLDPWAGAFPTPLGESGWESNDSILQISTERGPGRVAILLSCMGQTALSASTRPKVRQG